MKDKIISLQEKLNTLTHLLPHSLLKTLQNNVSGYLHSFAFTGKGGDRPQYKSKTPQFSSLTTVLKFPIIQSLAAIIPIAYAALPDNDHSTLFINKLALMLPTYSEWPLLFTTFRIVTSSLTH